METLTVTADLNAGNTGFEQETENTAEAVRDAEFIVPAVARGPDSVSPPVQDVAFCDDHISDTVLFARILIESAEIVAVGAFHAVTVTAGDEPEPPCPVQLME